MSKRLKPNLRTGDINVRRRHLVVNLARAAKQRFKLTQDCRSLHECRGRFESKGKTYTFETSMIEGKGETVIKLKGRGKLSDEEVSALLIEIGPKDIDTLSTFLNPKKK